MYAIFYDGVRAGQKTFDTWLKAENYLFEVYEDRGHTGFYIEEV